MTEYQVTFWRDIPSMVTARDGDDVTKVQLDARLQEAIDEAAMRLGASGSEAYLDGWTRGPWHPADGSTASVAAAQAELLDQNWDEQTIAEYLDSLGPGA